LNLGNHMLMSGSRYFCDSADFDGTNDYMTTGAGLTGIADGKQGTFSAWLRIDGGDGTTLRIFQTPPRSPAVHLIINRTSLNVFSVGAANSAHTSILSIQTAGTYVAGTSWIHLLASWDLATVGARHIYVNDVSDLSVTTFTNDTIDYTETDWAIGARTDGANPWNGCIAEFWFTTTYIDISSAANRRKFIGADGKPVSLGADGSAPTGTAPLVYQRIAKGAAASTFATNLGSGGNFTITGSLDVGSTSPSG
jgi:hypothetical protein